MDKFYQELQEILEVDEVAPADRLREFEAWDSLAALSLVASVHANFGVALSAAELRCVETAGELESLIQSKQKPV